MFNIIFCLDIQKKYINYLQQFKSECNYLFIMQYIYIIINK